jgi:hypothetical protein
MGSLLYFSFWTNMFILLSIGLLSGIFYFKYASLSKKQEIALSDMQQFARTREFQFFELKKNAKIDKSSDQIFVLCVFVLEKIWKSTIGKVIDALENGDDSLLADLLGTNQTRTETISDKTSFVEEVDK